MDFLRRDATNQAQTVRSNSAGQGPAHATNTDLKSKSKMTQPGWLRITVVVLLFSLTIVVVAIALLCYSGKQKESHFVDRSKEQAVFLTNGQVYFGNITALNDKYLSLVGIYYLNSSNGNSQTSTTNAQTSFSLVKLGCELHGPTDQMIINRDQVSFWENLKSDGKVAKAISQWVSQNPNGQTCSDSNSQNSTQQSTSTPNNTKQ